MTQRNMRFKPRILGQQTLRDGEDFREGGKGDQLKTEEHGNERIQERMHIKADAVKHPLSRQQKRAPGQPQQHQCNSRIKK